MSWNSEFVAEWQVFVDNIETRIRQEVERRDRIGLVTVNGIVQTELSKWEVQQNPSGAWLNRLRAAHTEIGTEVQATLKKANFSKSLDFEPLPYELRVVAGLGEIIAVHVILHWLKISFLKRLVGTVAFAVGLSLLYQVLWPNYRHQATALLLARLRQELGRVEQRLQEIVTKADSIDQV